MRLYASLINKGLINYDSVSISKHAGIPNLFIDLSSSRQLLYPKNPVHNRPVHNGQNPNHSNNSCPYLFGTTLLVQHLGITYLPPREPWLMTTKGSDNAQ